MLFPYAEVITMNSITRQSRKRHGGRSRVSTRSGGQQRVGGDGTSYDIGFRVIYYTHISTKILTTISKQPYFNTDSFLAYLASRLILTARSIQKNKNKTNKIRLGVRTYKAQQRSG